MKQTLLATLAVVALMLSFSPAAQADTFVSVTIGGTTVTCQTGGPCAAGFTNVNANNITFSTIGLGGGVLNGVAIANLAVSGNSIGTLSLATLNDTKTQVQNNNA